MDRFAKGVPVEARAVAVAVVRHESSEIDRTEVARVPRVQRLLATRIRRLDLADVLDRVRGVDAVDEDDARLTAAVGVVDDRVPQLAYRPAHGLAVRAERHLPLRVAFHERRPHLRARVPDLVHCRRRAP